MAEEVTLLKEMTLQLKNFEDENKRRQGTLEERHRKSIQGLNNQRDRFMHQIRQVRIIHSCNKSH